jgi:hypothetical protein
MGALYNSLYILSTALLIPVIVGLFLLLASTLVHLGGTFREWIQREKCRAGVRALVRRGLCPDPGALQAVRREALSLKRAPDYLRWFLAEVRGARLGVCYRLKDGRVIYVPEKPESETK